MAPDSSRHTQYHVFLRQSSSSRQTNASTALPELILISYALLTLVSWYLQLTFFRFALAQACLTTIVMFLVWPHGQPRLFHATRSAYAKYKILFVEFCVLVFIMCALLNSLARIRDASTPASNIISVVLRSQPFDLIVKLDVAAVLAIASAHATGHHDVCDRIVRRARWLSRRARDCCVMVWALCLRTLQEIPLEESNLPSGLLRRPSETECRSKPWIRPGPWKKSKPMLSSESTLDGDDIDEMDPSGKLVELRRATTTYEHIHAELRRVGARVRWSTVRYAFNMTRNPVNLSLLVNVGANPLAGSPVGQHNHEPGETRQWQPVINLPQRPRASSSSSAYNSPTTLRSMVFQAMDPVNVLKIFRMRAQEGQERFEMAEEINRFQEVQQPYLQLPGFINNHFVEALPDTGSSQNLIDANYLSSIDPDLRTMPQSHTGEKSLVAPDGGQIESVGTVKLKWRFKKEPKVYDIAFCIVENCSHRVIIGDGFLTETDTMEAEHSKNRLETRPEPNESADSSSLPSNSKGTQCYRRVVYGRVNGFDHCYASLDTGCEANLMSEECAQWLGLESRKLPDGHRTVRFADGRWAPLMGQVIIRWSFADDPGQTIELTCYILEKCIQPIIFGVHFVLQQDPFNEHRKAVETVIVDGACDAGVVGLEKDRKFPFGIFGKKKPNPQEVQEQKDRDEEHDRLEAMLHPQPHTPVNLPTQPQPAVTVSTAQSHMARPSAAPLQSSVQYPVSALATSTNNPPSSPPSTAGASALPHATPTPASTVSSSYNLPVPSSPAAPAHVSPLTSPFHTPPTSTTPSLSANVQNRPSTPTSTTSSAASTAPSPFSAASSSSQQATAGAAVPASGSGSPPPSPSPSLPNGRPPRPQIAILTSSANPPSP